jgi:hypothetical protein
VGKGTLKRTPGKALVPLAYERLGKSDMKYPFFIDWLLSDLSRASNRALLPVWK